MKTRDKIRIDRWLGYPTAAGLNLIARVLGKTLHRDHAVGTDNVRAIAVAKFLGMGSIIQSTPLLRALRRTYPEARIIFVTGKGNRTLIERLAEVDEAIYIDDTDTATLSVSTLAAVRALIERKIDLYFDLEVYSANASILALCAVSRNRYGFYRWSARFKDGIYTHLVYFNPRRPIAALYLQLGIAAGAQDDGVALSRIQIRDEDRAGASRKLEAAGVAPGAPYLVVNANASDLLLERRWPAQHFVAALEQLARGGHRVLLIGAPDEAEYVRSIHARLSAGARALVVDFAGQVSLAELFAVVDGAACVITNDTGPMHVAFSLDRPTVCLFGPQAPEHYGAAKANVATLYAGIVCSPCIFEIEEPPCAGNNVCMKIIEPAAVVAAVERLLSGADARSTMANGVTLRRDAAGRPLGMVVRRSLEESSAHE